MGMVSERYGIDQVLITSQILKELENEENEHIKKVYNVRLLNWLEA